MDTVHLLYREHDYALVEGATSCPSDAQGPLTPSPPLDPHIYGRRPRQPVFRSRFLECVGNVSSPTASISPAARLCDPPLSRTRSPGAMISGLILPSAVGPRELKKDTVSMSAEKVCVVDPSSSPSASVTGSCVSPEEDDPTASTFLPMAGLPMVHVVLTPSPAFPAAKISKCSGFFAGGCFVGRWHRG